LSNEAKIVESLYNISDELRTDTIDGFETFVFKKRIDPIYKVGNKYIDLERLVSVNDDIRDFRNDKRIIYEVAITTYFQLMDNPLEICFSNRISNADLYDFVKSEYEKLLEIWRKYKEQKEEDLLKLT
jgi:hypothetical protein